MEDDDGEEDEDEDRGPFTWREGTDVSREDETAVTAIAVEAKSMRKALWVWAEEADSYL